MPDEVEKIYSTETGLMYDIPFEDLYEYIEMVGFLEIKNSVPVDGITETIYVDIDRKFKPWEKSSISIVIDQVHREIRQKLLDAFFADDDLPFTEKSDIDQENLLGITGKEKIYLDETIWLYHKYKGGIWDTSEPNIVEIDKYSGKIFGKNKGTSQITYIVDTGSGMLTCFKTIEVI